MVTDATDFIEVPNDWHFLGLHTEYYQTDIGINVVCVLLENL